MFGISGPPTESPQQVCAALERGEVILIDVREPAEYAAERIDGALLFPLSSFDPATLPQDSGVRIVLLCGSGKRSASAFERCKSAGLAIRAHLGGGIAAWKRAGLPTVARDSSASGL